MGKKDAAQDLLRCLWLYPNYRVDSRGPYGLILDAIEKLDPEVAKKLREGEDPGDFVADKAEF